VSGEARYVVMGSAASTQAANAPTAVLAKRLKPAKTSADISLALREFTQWVKQHPAECAELSRVDIVAATRKTQMKHVDRWDRNVVRDYDALVAAIEHSPRWKPVCDVAYWSQDFYADSNSAAPVLSFSPCIGSDARCLAVRVCSWGHATDAGHCTSRLYLLRQHPAAATQGQANVFAWASGGFTKKFKQHVQVIKRKQVDIRAGNTVEIGVRTTVPEGRCTSVALRRVCIEVLLDSGAALAADAPPPSEPQLLLQASPTKGPMRTVSFQSMSAMSPSAGVMSHAPGAGSDSDGSGSWGTVMHLESWTAEHDDVFNDGSKKIVSFAPITAIGDKFRALEVSFTVSDTGSGVPKTRLTISRRGQDFWLGNTATDEPQEFTCVFHARHRLVAGLEPGCMLSIQALVDSGGSHDICITNLRVRVKTGGHDLASHGAGAAGLHGSVDFASPRWSSLQIKRRGVPAESAGVNVSGWGSAINAAPSVSTHAGNTPAPPDVVGDGNDGELQPPAFVAQADAAATNNADQPSKGNSETRVAVAASGGGSAGSSPRAGSTSGSGAGGDGGAGSESEALAATPTVAPGPVPKMARPPSLSVCTELDPQLERRHRSRKSMEIVAGADDPVFALVQHHSSNRLGPL